MNISVPRLLAALNDQERGFVENQINLNTELGIQWLEKIRRYVSYYNHNLKKESKRRFGNSYETQLEWYYRILLKFYERFSEKDNSILNAIFLLDRALPNNNANRRRTSAKLVKKAVSTLLSKPAEQNHQISTPTLLTHFLHLKDESSLVKGVIILSPSPYSLFSITILEICLRLNIKVYKIYILNFTPKRVFSELRRDGFRLFKKRVWRKLILKSDENNIETQISLKRLFNELSNNSDIRNLAKSQNILVENVDDFSEISACKDPDIYTLFTGGGLITQETLEKLNSKVINTHMGLLPFYRGMDVVESPILDGNFHSVALNTHLMTNGLDEGPMIQTILFNSDEYMSLAELRNEISGLMPIIAIDSLCGLVSQRLQLVPQDLQLGKQYYFIERRLISMINNLMLSRNSLIDVKSKIRIQNKNTFFNFLKIFS